MLEPTRQRRIWWHRGPALTFSQQTTLRFDPVQGWLLRGMLLTGAGVMALLGLQSAPVAQSTEQQTLQRQIDELGPFPTVTLLRK